MKFNTIIASVLVYFGTIILGCYITGHDSGFIAIQEFKEIHDYAIKVLLYVLIAGGIRGFFLRSKNFDINNSN